MSKLNPEMVRLARESRGMTQTELADAADVGQGTVSKLELGEKDVSADTVDRIAAELGYPVSFFFQEERYAGLGISIMYFRKRASALQKHLRPLQARVNILRLQAKILRRDVAIEFPAEIQRHDINDFLGTPEEIATMARAELGIPAGPVRNVISCIENAGGFVYKFPFGTTDIDALSHWPDDGPPMFFVNAQAPTERARFSLAHELGHMVMHDGPRESMETEAHQFAAAFLMPRGEIRPHLLEMTIEKAFSLKPYWRVSAGALIVRAHDLECMSDHRYSSLYKYFTKLGYRLNEPAPIKPTEEPQLVKKLVAAYLEQGGFGVQEMARMLHFSEQEFRDTYLERDGLRIAM